MTTDKECFIICPIGSEGSDTRERANKLRDHIIDEAVRDFGYRIVRADEISEPGSITTQIIEQIINSDLVIADLTDHNPNVFYELALRHAAAKPYIQLIDSSQNIPFDISDLRTVNYDFDVSTASSAITEIQSQIEAIEQENGEIENPISRSANLKSWRESENPIQQNLANISESLTSLHKRIEDIDGKVREIENNQQNTLQRTSNLTNYPNTSSIEPFEIDAEKVEIPDISEEKAQNIIERLNKKSKGRRDS